MTSREYLNTLDKILIETLSKIIIEENKTSRLIRKTPSPEFIQELCQIIDNHSAHWNKEEKDDF